RTCWCGRRGPPKPRKPLGRPRIGRKARGRSSALFLAEAGALSLGLGPIGLGVLPASLALELVPVGPDQPHQEYVVELAAVEGGAARRALELEAGLFVGPLPGLVARQCEQRDAL